MKIDKLNYVDNAEKVIKNLEKDKKGALLLTTTQIRKILSMINELYSMVRKEHSKVMSAELQSHIQYIKMKLIYEAGREKSVKDLLNKADLINIINSIGKDSDNLVLLCHYTEALVAYHRFYTN